MFRGPETAERESQSLSGEGVVKSNDVMGRSWSSMIKCQRQLEGV